MTKVTRRHFLITGGALLGACFLPASLLRRVRDHQLATNELLIEGPERVQETLYATKKDDGRWQFALGAPTTEFPPAPTWREWLRDYKEVDPEDRDDLARWIWENRGEVTGPSRHWLNDDIPFHRWEDYLEGRYATYDSPEAQALVYLERLKLAHGPIVDSNGKDVGALHYYHGTMPGVDWHFVEGSGALILPGLQHRLRELGEDTLIVESGGL